MSKAKVQHEDVKNAPSSQEKESEKGGTADDGDATMNWKIIVVLVFVVLIYVIIGGVIFHFIEEPNETSVRTNTINLSNRFTEQFSCVTQAELQTFVKAVIAAYDQGVLASNESSSQSNWDIASSIFFANTVVTTIGYGHISPSTRGGQAFCSVFALIGIPLNLVLLAAIGGKLAKVGQKLKNLKSLQDKPRASITVRLVVCVGIGSISLIFIPAGVFVATEGWTYGTALYYCIITLTTVGFGDYVAGVDYSGNLRALYRISLCLWILIGLAWVGWLIGDCQEFGTTVVSKIGKKNDGTKDGDKSEGDGNKNIEGGKRGKTNEVMMSNMPDA